ncbi:MHYT domain-containing protein [Microbulbifer yueqingensis]|uniref:MHYT domain-containing protein, NO-binding membrane sensor n=1 Tax=Microbulbifer yueqingensis TaxID=658219 RepID=A0A1G8VJU1_9GAMM|nr:MHYT domain-containing protein [Microbulbifer yueqingensis]SDJ66263.1 MHYT domain-containing protein, NO-binding membrane sensor [Microbulbifer yueqingensis]
MSPEYDLSLVALSYVISALGSFAALQLVTAIPEAVTGDDRRRAILVAGLAMGGGAIWSMHFVGMLALQTEMSMAYDVAGTLGSVLVAVAACTLGLAIVGTGIFSFDRLLPASVFMGAGVAGMHYSGMEAMLMPARIEYDLNIMIISVVIAVVVAYAALWMAFQMRGHWQKIASALVMGVAVCGMHYTGMAAAEYRMTGATPAAGFAGAIDAEHLGLVAGLVTLAVLLSSLAAARWYRRRLLTMVAGH